MPKPTLQPDEESEKGASRQPDDPRKVVSSPLAELVSSHLRDKRMRQVDFCRQTGFDQGLLSKILSSVVSTLNIETALKLAEGLNVPPAVVFEVIGKKNVDERLRRFYARDYSDPVM